MELAPYIVFNVINIKQSKYISFNIGILTAHRYYKKGLGSNNNLELCFPNMSESVTWHSFEKII